MIKYKIIKDEKDELKGFEKWENGKKQEELKQSNNELPPQANWRSIKDAREWKQKDKKGKPPWANGDNQGQDSK